MNWCRKVVFEVLIALVMREGTVDTSRNRSHVYFEGTPYMSKDVRTVWVGGKTCVFQREYRSLPIDIANNAFKRAAYGLIDYYLEEERELRLYAQQTKMPLKVLETKVDQLWSRVTLYNCYQLFVQLTSKKLKNPTLEFNQKYKAGEFNNIPEEEYEKLLTETEEKALLWENKPEVDLLTLFFNATNTLPKNQMRTLVGNADNALRSIGGAEKMLSSVYGIAITAMVRLVDFVKSKISLYDIGETLFLRMGMMA